MDASKRKNAGNPGEGKRLKLYDRIAWYADEGNGTARAIERMTLLMKWLDAKGLLSDIGKAELEAGINEDSVLNAPMLTDRGDEVVGTHYMEWVRSGKGFETFFTPFLKD